MLLRCAVDGHELSDAVLVESATIRQDSTEAISTCELSFLQKFGAAYYDDARYDQASFYSIQPSEWSELILYDADTSQVLFGGFVLRIERDLEGPHLIRRVSASDWGILLERTLITQTWPDGTPDSVIVADALRLVPELQAGTIVTLIAQLGEIEAKDMRIRDLLDNVCELTGGEWHVSATGRLNYYRIGSIVPPFSLSDHPNGTTSMPYALEGVQTEFSDAANYVRVLGALNDDGTEVTAVAQDASSQQRFGVLSITVVDRNITDAANAVLAAQVEVAQRAWPTPTVNATVYVPGLARGQSVDIESKRYGLGGTFILRSLDIVILGPDRTRAGGFGHKLKYTATFGMRTPDMVYMLRRMQRRPVERTVQPPAPVLPGSIGWDNFASGIAPIFNVSRRPEGAEWANYPADATFFNTTDRKLYRRIAGNDWTAVVNTADIEGQIAATTILLPGSVTSTILADGSVITAKIPDGAIQGPKLAASSVTANVIAANAIYSEALQSNIIKSIHITSNAITAGKIDALAVVAGNIAADAVTAGTIAAGAVRAGSLAADAVTAGTIAAGAIRAEDAAFATAAIKDADIEWLKGEKISVSSIDSTKLNAVEIAVGFGGNKPGRFGVYAPTGLIGLIGDLGGAGLPGGQYFGIWAKLGSFGGSGYADAPMYTDSAGNLFLRQADFSVTSGSQSVKVTNKSFDPSYSSIGVNVFDGTNRSWLVGRGVVTYNAGNQVLAACITHPVDTNAGQIYCQKPGGFNTYCMMDGQLGRIRADNGFVVGSTRVIDETGAYIGTLKPTEYRVAAGNLLVINSSGTFVGAGVATPGNGHSAAGFNPFVAGVQYNGVSTGSFTTADGKTVQVRGGVIVSIT